MSKFLEDLFLFVTVLIGIMVVLGLGLFYLSFFNKFCGG